MNRWHCPDGAAYTCGSGADGENGVGFFSATDGTLLNVATVLIGGTIGTLAGDRLPARVHDSLFGVLGLFVILIGLLDAFTTKNPLIMLGALVVGTMLGEALNIEAGLVHVGEWAQKRFAREGSTFSNAFVTSSLVFCVGPLSILGSLDNGLSGDFTKLAIKSVLDGLGALAFSAALGYGVLLSAGVILIYQGGISLAARFIAPALMANPRSITEMTAVGGLMLVAIGLRILNIRDLRVASMLPALALAPLLVAVLSLVPHFVS